MKVDGDMGGGHSSSAAAELSGCEPFAYAQSLVHKNLHSRESILHIFGGIRTLFDKENINHTTDEQLVDIVEELRDNMWPLVIREFAENDPTIMAASKAKEIFYVSKTFLALSHETPEQRNRMITVYIVGILHELCHAITTQLNIPRIPQAITRKLEWKTPDGIGMCEGMEPDEWVADCGYGMEDIVFGARVSWHPQKGFSSHLILSYLSYFNIYDRFDYQQVYCSDEYVNRFIGKFDSWYVQQAVVYIGVLLHS